MSNKQQNIKAIEQAEQAAADQIARAREKAKTELNQLDAKMQEEFRSVKETLTEENAKLADKVQKEAVKFKEATAAELKQDLASMEQGAPERIKQAANQVIEQFRAYVGQ